MATLESLQKEINILKERNKRVELDKKWEGSWVRRILIVVMTYVTIVCYLIFIDVQEPFINAVVPVIGFLLSTLTLRFFKQLWINFQK